MRAKPFSPAPHEIGSVIRWRHLLPGGREIARTGTVVGRAPALGAGHSREVWCVPDTPLPSDIYSGGVVVAVARGRGYVPSGAYAAVVAAGQAFSDNRPSSPTGGIAAMNARRSWESRQQHAA